MSNQQAKPEVSRRKFGEGQCPDLLIDDEKYAWESLYVEAVINVDGKR